MTNHSDAPSRRRRRGARRHKTDPLRLLERAIPDSERLVTDAEVLQENLHRHVAIPRRDAIQPAFDALLLVGDEGFPVEVHDVERAKIIVMGRPALSARDGLHVATMQRHGLSRVMSFVVGFDGVPGLQRVRA